MHDENDLTSIREVCDGWESETRGPSVEKGGEREDQFVTVSSHGIDDLYASADVADLDYESDLNFPGGSPYTHGAYPTMYRERTWTMRQFAGFSMAKEINECFHYPIENSQARFSTAFNIPSLMSKDPDDPLSGDEVGKRDVAVDTLRDMGVLFDGIDIGGMTTSFTISLSAPVVFAMYVTLVDNHGVPREQVGGTFRDDIFKEFIMQEEWITPPEPSLKLITDTVEFAVEETPHIRPISVSGYHTRKAGSTVIQELASTLADDSAYIGDAVDRGLDVGEFTPQLSFFFNSHNSIFEEMVKFRTVRRIYHDMMSE